MNDRTFIPKKIKVGYDSRKGTYTGKLAYIIYYDHKGKLRKKVSWENWRAHSIEPNEYENVPTQGFVLNKKAGGYSTGWNHRQTYCRVYDPRGFEFEISIENLLYILDNCSCIKGKGLEGEFVYGWLGTELLLLPTSAPDYKETQAFSSALFKNKKLKGKDLILGATYLTKENEEVIYLGRFNEFESYLGWRSSKIVTKEIGKRYFFILANIKNDKNVSAYRKYKTCKYPSQLIIDVVSTDCVEDYAFLIDDLEHTTKYSPIDHKEYEKLTKEDIEFIEERKRYAFYKLVNGEWLQIQYYRYSIHDQHCINRVLDSCDNWIKHTYNEKFDTLRELCEYYDLYKRNLVLKNGNKKQG